MRYSKLKDALAELGAKLFSDFCTGSCFRPKEYFVLTGDCLKKDVLVPFYAEFALPGQEMSFLQRYLDIFKQELGISCSQKKLEEAIEGVYYPDDSRSHLQRQVVEGIWEIKDQSSGPRAKDNSESLSIHVNRDGFWQLAVLTPGERLELLGWVCFDTYRSYEDCGFPCECDICSEDGCEEP